MAATKKIVQKTFILASGLAFLGMMTVPMLGIFTGGNGPTVNQNQEQVSLEQLQSQAEGYERILAREPDNPIALQGLVETRLQLGDLEGAIPPLEKLSDLYPEEKGLKQLLEAIKAQVETGTIPLPPPSEPQP